MVDPCACAHGVPARANSLYCADCYRLGCEPGACHLTPLAPLVVACRHLQESTPYYSRSRLEQDYEDELRRRDERSGR